LARATPETIAKASAGVPALANTLAFTASLAFFQGRFQNQGNHMSGGRSVCGCGVSGDIRDHSLAKALLTLWSLRRKAARRCDFRTTASNSLRIHDAGVSERADARSPARHS
jgi:hypothetical protein